MTKGTYKDLRVWREAVKLAVGIYRATADFPRYEVYGLSQQMRRAAVSVPSNIAEGKGHRSSLEFARFLHHARGSLLELQTQLLISEQLQYLSKDQISTLTAHSDLIAKGLNALINAVCGKNTEPTTND